MRAIVWLLTGLLLLCLCLCHAEAQTIFANGFEDEAPGEEICPDPQVDYAGWEIVRKTWQQAFSSPDGSPQAAFPNGVGFPVPIPGRYPGAGVGLSNLIRKGSITVIGPFTAPANATITLTWDQAQANGGQGYPQPRPAQSMFIAVSECPGDVRSLLPMFDPCARQSGAGSLFWTTKVANASTCQLEAGRIYYYTVVMGQPQDGLTVGEHTCSTSAPNSANGCDVQMRHTAVVTAPRELPSDAR